MNKYNLKYIFIYFFCSIILFTNNNNAQEILVYADNISYDSDENIVAKGSAKIFYNNQFILSELIIYNKKDNKIILPTTFTLKDSNNNFLSGSSGFFDQYLNYGEFNDIKIKLNDGSRLIGEKGKRDGHVDVISKGVYTPCKSRIKIANFICPTWQLEGEKILHDNKNLFLYQKHSKMRVVNTPVFYIPYIVTPSPLRKDRKSGFLSPSLSFNFFDTKTSQSASFPYYFNLAQDKELIFTPIANYGGGVDSSQRFNFDYDQILSGGNFSSNLTFDSNFEKENNNKWLTDASLITNYSQNLNDKYKISLESALQTSQNYIQITEPDNELSYKTSLSSKLHLQGYNIYKFDDYFDSYINYYQSNQKTEDNKTIPIVLPSINYYSGEVVYYGNTASNNYEFYNILRDKSTDIHSKRQQKISHNLNTAKEILKYNSKITFNTLIYNQFYNTENKLIEESNYHSGSLYRFFPILSATIQSPFKLKRDKNNFTFEPSLQLVITPGISNSEKISNEDSSNNSFTIENLRTLNRYSGTDKMDNSKRINYGFSINNNNIELKLAQTYEFTNNSNFHKEQGNEKHLSDLLGSFTYEKINKLNYNFRYDSHDNYLKEQNVYSSTNTKIGNITLSYLDQKSKTDEVITQDNETLNYTFQSKEILNFSKVKFSGLYDLKQEINTEYNLGYSYIDECFNVDINFYRKSYKEDSLKPQDILTLMFSFKNIGSYKSNNLNNVKNGSQDLNWKDVN